MKIPIPAIPLPLAASFSFLALVLLQTTPLSAKNDHVLELKLFNGNHFSGSFNSGMGEMSDLGDTSYTDEDGNELTYTGLPQNRAVFRTYLGFHFNYMFGIDRLHYISAGGGMQLYNDAELLFGMTDANDDLVRNDSMQLSLTAIQAELGYNYRLEISKIHYLMLGAGLALYPVSMSGQITTSKSITYEAESRMLPGFWLRATFGHFFTKSLAGILGLHYHTSLSGSAIQLQGSNTVSFVESGKAIKVKRSASSDGVGMALSGIQLELGMQYFIQ
jgi:hypothetical protein